MNDSMSETEMISCDVEQSDENERTHMIAEVNTNVTFCSSKKKVRLGHMKMLCYGLLTSSNLFALYSHQDLVEVDSEILVTGTIIGILRK